MSRSKEAAALPLSVCLCDSALGPCVSASVPLPLCLCLCISASLPLPLSLPLFLLLKNKSSIRDSGDPVLLSVKGPRG